MATLIGILIILQKFAETMGGIKNIAANYEPYLWTGFFIGILFGAWTALVFIKTGVELKHWLDAKHDFRTERLMLKYYDMTNRK